MLTYSKILIVNGVEFPTPLQGFRIKTTQAVDAGRNAAYEFIGQEVGRRTYKIEGLEWHNLPIDVWTKMREAIGDFVVPVTFTNDKNERITISMYPGDTDATPLRADDIFYTEMETCAFNLVDCGYREEGEPDAASE